MKIIECDVDHVHYWIASLGLGDTLANRLLAKAMREGRCPMGMGDLALEMIDECQEWCDANCTADFKVDPTYQLQIWFAASQDAMRFKLTHG